MKIKNYSWDDKTLNIELAIDGNIDLVKPLLSKSIENNNIGDCFTQWHEYPKETPPIGTFDSYLCILKRADYNKSVVYMLYWNEDSWLNTDYKNSDIIAWATLPKIYN